MKSAPQRPIFVSVNIKQKYMKLILRLGLILFTGFISISTASAQLYGTADTNAPELRVPTSVKPAFDYWMRDTWATLGPDGYYYITGTTSTPDRYFPGQRHCWDWNDGLYLWRSKDMKSWEARGQIWSMEKDGTWQKKPKVYKAGEKYQKKSINGDPMDNRFHAVWAPEMHYIKSAKNWFIVACMNESAGGRGSFILRSKTGKPEGPYENIEGNKDKAIFPNIDGSLFEDTDGTVYFVGHNHYIARMKPDMSGFAEELKTLKEKKYNPENLINKYIMKEIKHNNMDNFDVTFIEPELQAFIDKYKNDYVKVMNGKIPKCMFTVDKKRWDLKVATPTTAIYQNKDAGYCVINTMRNTVETVKEYNIAFLLQFIENDTLLYGSKKDIAEIRDKISKDMER